MFKKSLFVVLVISCLFRIADARSKETKIRVLALSATSSQAPSFDLAGLLDGTATLGWKPGMIGSGAEEGIFIQFENPVKMDAVRLEGKGSFVVSMNGVEINEDGGYFYVPGRIGVKTLFIHLPTHPVEPTELTGIELCRKGTPLPVERPVVVEGEVKATNVLSPELAYGAFRLFDSRPDLAFALDGNKIDTDKSVPLFDLKFHKPVNLKGFFIWNGYQRSDDLYVANARSKEITVRNGSSSARFLLADKMGPQWFAFPGNGWNTSSLNFEANSIFPGRDYKDLVLSEICFATNQNDILTVRVPRPPLEVPKGLEKVVDQSLASFAMESVGDYSLKLRSDGTFAAIQETTSVDNGPSRKIWEGNWVPTGSGEVKVFGKSYSSEPSQDQSIYGNEVSKPQVKTFQTTLKITDLSDPKPETRDWIFKLVKAEGFQGDDTVDSAAFWKELKTRTNAIFVESNLFSQVMVLDKLKK